MCKGRALTGLLAVATAAHFAGVAVELKKNNASHKGT